jgi:RHS repeat-associated protein
MYDNNTLDSSFSGSYTQGRLVAVQNAQFTPGNGSLVGWVQMVEMYGYTQPGSVSGKRLQANEHIPYPVGYGQTLTRNLDAAYTYDNEGKMTSAGYPTTWTYTGGGVAQSTPGPTYSYSFDSMSRLAGMTDQNSNTDVSGVTYNAANQLTGITYFGSPETRTYNSLGQMTQLYVNSGLYYNYNYPAGPNNNGKISSTYEALSGETISYTYDSLNRMATAAGSGWAETYGYDGFGNLTAKTPTAGTPPSLSQAANPANNRILGYSYDANGNQLGAPGFYGSPTYDVENRMVAAPGAQYAYDSHNKRVWTATVDGSNNLTGQTVNFYGVNGQKIGSYSLAVSYGVGQLLEFSDPPANLAIYFGGKRVATTQGGTTTSYWQDRLGSNRNSGSRYYPWGEDRSTPSNDQVRFATYTRDSATLLDYADQRYYGNAQGRFMTPDPYFASGKPGSPQSWNRYAYTRGDPVNASDPTGLFLWVGDDGDDPGPDGDEDIGEVFSYDGCYPNYDPIWGNYYGCGSLPTVSAQGAQGSTNGKSGTVQAGMQVATRALQDVANTVFSPQCQIFIDNALGAGALELAQLEASQTTVQNAAGITTAAGSTLFPNNPGLAAQQQAKANQVTGINGASLSEYAAASPFIYAWGQYTGDTVFINNAASWADWGNGWALYTMLHEMLHVEGFGDQGIEAAFGISPETVAAQGSVSITYKLLSECGQ